MEQKTDYPEELCIDEAVRFIADRHHLTPHQLLCCFLTGGTSIPLEPNEVEILRGLSNTAKERRENH